MSAFLVSNETVNKVVSYMLPENGACEDGDLLGMQLIGMNYLALAARYGDVVPDDITFRYRHRKYSKCEQHKAMRCLRYQCAEGSVPELALFAQLSEAIDRCALEIVDSLPEYDAAPWDSCEVSP